MSVSFPASRPRRLRTSAALRDLVAETVEIEGIPLRFVDTAGIREALDEAESIGIQKSQEAAADADLAGGARAQVVGAQRVGVLAQARQRVDNWR